MTPDQARAADLFQRGFNCTQAVLLTLLRESDLDPKTALALATGFGGGMGRQGEVCGAVSGATILLGLRFGMREESQAQAKQRTNHLVGELLRRFSEIHGSVRCRELLGIKGNMDEGFQEARSTGRSQRDCPRFVATACELAERLLEESP